MLGSSKFVALFESFHCNNTSELQILKQIICPQQSMFVSIPLHLVGLVNCFGFCSSNINSHTYTHTHTHTHTHTPLHSVAKTRTLTIKKASASLSYDSTPKPLPTLPWWGAVCGALKSHFSPYPALIYGPASGPQDGPFCHCRATAAGFSIGLGSLRVALN